MLPLLLSSAAFLAPPSPDVLLARAAELVLRARLSERDEVRVQVSGGSRMLSGGVEAVSVHGTRWCTPLRLSCRRIDLSVGRTDVDLPSLVSRQRIVLRRPAEGSASIFFSARDWDNFLAHPQMAVAVAARRGRSGAPRRIRPTASWPMTLTSSSVGWMAYSSKEPPPPQVIMCST